MSTDLLEHLPRIPKVEVTIAEAKEWDNEAEEARKVYNQAIHEMIINLQALKVTTLEVLDLRDKQAQLAEIAKDARRIGKNEWYEMYNSYTIALEKYARLSEQDREKFVESLTQEERKRWFKFTK